MKVLNKLKTPRKNQNKKIGKPFSRKVKDIKWIPVNLLDILLNFFDSVKSSFVYRSYWGRGSTYKQILHAVIFIITVTVALSGISYRIFGLNAATQSLSENYLGNSGNIDVLQQGNSLQSVLTSNPSTPFKVNYYKVVEGDSLQSIADKFGVSKDTIKWSNVDKFGNYDRYNDENVNPGEELKIPEVSGVLYEVRDGDSLDSILEKTSGDRFSTIEVNQLTGETISIAGRQSILVPNGRLPAPQPPEPVYSVFYRPRPSPGDCNSGTGTPINGVSLVNPLCHPACEGYSISQYFSGPYPAHDGIDLSKGGGCPLRSICDGTVTYVGYAGFNNGGYVVKVNCGNGVEGVYFHGDGNFWVSNGESVSKGQDLMYMGCSGWCTGTHLHLILKVNGATTDPGPYVPL